MLFCPQDQDETEQRNTAHGRQEEKDTQGSEASDMEEEDGDDLPLSISKFYPVYTCA